MKRYRTLNGLDLMHEPKARWWHIAMTCLVGVGLALGYIYLF